MFDSVFASLHLIQFFGLLAKKNVALQSVLGERCQTEAVLHQVGHNKWMGNVKVDKELCSFVKQ